MPRLTPTWPASRTLAGDYHEGQLSGVMSDGALIADIVSTWKKLGEGRPTVAFCVDRAHAAKVQARFLEAGIGCGYIDSYTERGERNRIRQQLDRGEISVVANVGCLVKGVDWALGCIILARPTKSEMLYVQMVGRGLRVNDGIPDCIILDHADNTLRLSFVTDIFHGELCKAIKGERKAQPVKEALPKECSACSFLKPPKIHECPACGFKPERQSEIEEEAGELIEITRARMKADKSEKQAWFSQLQTIARERRYTDGWVSQTYRKRFGVWPAGLSRNRPTQATTEVRNFVKYQLIRFAKGKESRAA
jgi:DNA repair protein RadD